MFFTYEARMYSQLAFFTAFVVWMYWRVLSQAGTARWWQWLALTLGSAALISTHYFGILFLPWTPIVQHALSIRDQYVPTSDQRPAIAN